MLKRTVTVLSLIVSDHDQAFDARVLPADALPAHAVQGERLRHDAPVDDNGSACCPSTPSTGINCIKIGLPGKLILSERKGLREVLSAVP